RCRGGASGGVVRGRAGAVAAVLAATLAAVGSGCSAGATCPAVGYGTTLEVRLFDGWPDRDAHTVEVSCPDAEPDCGVGEDEDLSGPRWFASVGAPDLVEVRVLDAAGTVVSERAVEPDYRVVAHPHGTACGGPRGAVVSLVDR